MKAYLRIVLILSFFITLFFLAMTVCADEKTANEHNEESPKVLRFTNYNDLKGEELIRMVQLTLKDSGIEPGPIDGILGPKTRNAIKMFQLKKGLEPTGELDKQTMDQLFWSF